jgi:hypothetical protein
VLLRLHLGASGDRVRSINMGGAGGVVTAAWPPLRELAAVPLVALPRAVGSYRSAWRTHGKRMGKSKLFLENATFRCATARYIRLHATRQETADREKVRSCKSWSKS